MRYYDSLYDVEWELPEIIEKIVHTKEMVRLRNIVQGIMPNNLNVLGPLPSRFQHSMGVCYLAQEVIKNNLNKLGGFDLLLPVSALLHDAGSPPFSHLSEPFLKEVTGHDGESFLAEILDDSETEKILKEYGIHAGTVVKMVTGNWKPFSDVLHGSLDIDNLDNIARHAKATNIRVDFKAEEISNLFSFKGEWFISGSFLESHLQVLRWKEARKKVYGSIYSAPHRVMATMLYRALEFAYSEGELEKDFFFMDDYGAILYLKTCNARTQKLIHRLLRWQTYEIVVNFETTKPSDKVKAVAQSWRRKKEIADLIAKKLELPEEDVCVMISKGKEKRKISLPFLDSLGSIYFDDEPESPVYRLRVYMAPNSRSLENAAYDLLMQETN